VIVPSIDLVDGQAVQLIGGRDHALTAGDPRPIAQRFALAGEVAVVDLDAALGRRGNTAVIDDLLTISPCRVGGGIRSFDAAVRWLDAGASRIVLGTAAAPDLLRRLPRERVIAALDAEHGEVVVEGWRTRTGKTVLQRMKQLQGLVSGFLVTFVEREGRMDGTHLELVPQLVEAAGDGRVTIAGGVTTPDDVARLDAMGADAQVGMSLYTGRMELADAITAPLRSDRRDGLWPTVVTDEAGAALGLAYSSAQSVREAVRTRRGVYHSRARGLWVKGESSGHSQDLLRIDLDCDRDTLRFTVRQRGQGFCHTGQSTCWGRATGLPALAARIGRAAELAPPDSYSSRLLGDAGLLRAKLAEEAAELAAATSPVDVAKEAADVIYFTLIALQRAGATLADVAAELDKRALRVTRRPGDAKPDRRSS
jgi:phosphoribosyl-ATP pyrophosphohydrolase